MPTLPILELARYSSRSAVDDHTQLQMDIDEAETTRITNVDGRFLRHPSPYIKEHFSYMQLENRVYTIDNAMEDCGVKSPSYKTALKTNEVQIKPYPVKAQAATDILEAQVDTTDDNSTPVSASATTPAPANGYTFSTAMDPYDSTIYELSLI